MARGDILPSERREFTQPETGVRAVQLTSASCANVNAYYNYEQFIGDSLVFYSDRSGVRQIYKVEIDSGKIVQLTDAPVDVGNFAAVPHQGRVYYASGDEVRVLDAETLADEPVSGRLPGCGRPGLEDVSSCGRYLVLSARPERVVAETSPETSFRIGSENRVVLCDAERGEQAVVYEGPSTEAPVAADSHLFISRDDPSYVWWGSYTRLPPAGFKTAWALECDTDVLAARRHPRPLFNQQPWEFINHYYPAPDAHAEMLLYQYSGYERDGMPLADLWKGFVSRKGEYLGFMLDADLRTGTARRWLFPGQPPLHFQRNKAGDLWAGDCADPGFLWFEGRRDEARRLEEVDPEGCPPLPENHDYHWLGSGAWIGVFQKRGAFLEMRPLVRHGTQWAHVHPHPSFSPDGRWIVYASGDRTQSQVFVAEAVWPRWFA